jgi:hypothetical protein
MVPPEHGQAEDRSPVDQLLDLVVYAPLGLLMNLDELLPQLVEKGHQQVDMARMFGKFAVRAGSKEARKRIGDLAGSRPGGPTAPAPTAAPAASPPGPAGAEPGPAPEPAVAPGPDGSVPASADLGISDYDALSASQVVPRLNGLGPDELEAVRRYEAGHRGRKTILAKIAQLQA